MSHKTYNELWAETQNLLNEITDSDSLQISSKPTKDKTIIRSQICTLFMKYSISIIKLSKCYDQIVHPQKRILIKKILDMCIIRYLELKQEVVALDATEFTYQDGSFDQFKLLPTDTDIPVPKFYLRERMENVMWKSKFIDNVVKKIAVREQAIENIHMTEDEAILMIQMHERARQGRLRAQFMKNIRSTKEKNKDTLEKGISEFGWKSALKIQRTWRGFITRKKIRERVNEEMILIGMLPPANYKCNERMEAEQAKTVRYQIQEQYQQEYEEALIHEKECIQKYKTNIITQKIKDEVRNWYITYQQQSGRFPEIPSEEFGGSATIIGHYSPLTPGSETSKSTTIHAASSESKLSRSKKSDSFQEEKRRQSIESISGYKVGSSNILSDLITAIFEYEEIWKDLNENDNPEQKYDIGMIRAQKYSEVETELRKVVDVQLRIELEELQAALDRDQKGKKTKKGMKKKKGRRSGKKGKKKKDKDLTPDRSVESLFEELVTNGIIRKCPQVELSSFKGELSYIPFEYQKNKVFFSPSLGDIRQVIRDYCILPLSSMMIHELAPLNRSLLIAGPTGCGKDMLVNAICTETGAVLFDLSAANIAGKYSGKAGLVMLIHLINKVTKLLQPSIIYIDDAEKTFLKKVPKTDKTDPKRLKKDISKIVKAIGPSDLVMLIGVSRSPWECDQKALSQTYDKTIMTIKPDYASIELIWQEFFRKYKSMNSNISALVKISDGYTIGTIIKVMKQMMTCKRVLQLRIHPLTFEEIINVISLYEPVYKEEEEAFLQWYLKTPIGKNKLRILELESENN